MAAAALKRRPLESVDQSLADSVPDLADDPEVATGKLQEKSILAACISKLSPHHREIINLIYYREKSITEVAEIIGVPRSTVKTRMFYARNEIAELLKEHGSEWARPRKALRTLCVAH
jgi:RNA polymerase sigma-70 factor (ECF subfamily)